MVVAIARLFESPLEEELCLKIWIVFQILLLHVNCMEIFFVIVYNSRNRILKFKVDQMINLLTTQPTLIAVWTNQKHRHMDTPPHLVSINESKFTVKFYQAFLLRVNFNKFKLNQ